MGGGGESGDEGIRECELSETVPRIPRNRLHREGWFEREAEGAAAPPPSLLDRNIN